MRALVHNLLLEFQSNQPQVLGGWRQIFDLEIEAAAGNPDLTTPQIRVAAAVVEDLERPPETRPAYEEPDSSDQKRRLRYYETGSGGFLDLARPAQISFNFESSTAKITLTRQVLDAGSLEDLTIIALAPFLRRRGIFVAHAFCAAKTSAIARGAAVLFCGPPGSGKTTTGLALLDQGWSFLANDAALLGEEQGLVKVYPSPGAINLHPETLTHLPQYRDRVNEKADKLQGGKLLIPRGVLLANDTLEASAAVGFIFFPRLTNHSLFSLHEVPSAVGLARLIEENVEQWDKDTYTENIDLLTTLSRQAAFYDLQIPRGLDFNPGFFDLLSGLPS
jgi:hypothetical protein